MYIASSVSAGGETMLLVDDGRLRLVDLEGNLRWSSPSAGWMVYWGDLRGNGRDYLLLSGSRQLVLFDGATGEEEWSHRFEPDHAQIRIAVGYRGRPGSSWTPCTLSHRS